MEFLKRNIIVLSLTIVFALQLTDGDGIVLPDQVQQPLQQTQERSQLPNAGGSREGKHLLDFVGLGTGPNTDPYMARTNKNCLAGELAECFKSQAISTFSDFFNKQEYFLTENARIVRVPENQYRSLEQEPYEYSTEPTPDEDEWNQMLKFGLRKIEKFVKSAIIEVNLPEEVTEGGRYSPRFISDGIADELDVLEDKSSPLLKKHKLKKLFLPLLIILKLFKLKLLLFLPLILGLATFKKFLGFAAIIIPGIIGYFKLCRPQQNHYGNGYSNGFQEYSPQGVGAASYTHQHTHFDGLFNREQQNYAKPYGEYYGKNQYSNANNNFNNFDQSVRFGDDLAYQGQSQYRSKT